MVSIRLIYASEMYQAHGLASEDTKKSETYIGQMRYYDKLAVEQARLAWRAGHESKCDMQMAWQVECQS